MLIEKEEPSKEGQEPIYDEGDEEEDDSMLFEDKGKALVVRRACLLRGRRKKIGGRPTSFIHAVQSRRKSAKLLLMEGATKTSSPWR